MLRNSMKTKAIGESVMALTIIVPTQDVYKTKIFHTLGHCHFSLETLESGL